MIIAVDFDGTCVTHRYPDIGLEIGAPEVLRDLAAAGHQLILWTMRSDETLAAAVKWFESHNIPLFGVNENPQQKAWTNSLKAYANVYIDDAALGAPLRSDLPLDRPYMDWASVRAKLLPVSYVPAEYLQTEA